jgi:hypothetical protein
MVQQGTTFARVEDVIDAARFSDHHKAALWLLAWSLREPSLQRREARLMAGIFATADDNRPAHQQSGPGETHGQLKGQTNSHCQTPHLRRR